jgi:predicted dinucleotide-binding enzyme
MQTRIRSVGWTARSAASAAATPEKPDRIADEIVMDAAVQAADTVLLTVPSQLGVDYNAAMLETIARDIAPAFGWSPNNFAPSLPGNGADRA